MKYLTFLDLAGSLDPGMSSLHMNNILKLTGLLYVPYIHHHLNGLKGHHINAIVLFYFPENSFRVDV